MPLKKEAEKKNCVEVRRSSAGLGLYAARDFSRGETVIEYVGKRLKGDHGKRNLYIFNVDHEWDIDGSPRWNTARYINHSCKPNCEAVNDDNRIFIVAKRKIRSGEELAYDYGEDYFKEIIEPKGCRCVRCTKGKDA